MYRQYRLTRDTNHGLSLVFAWLETDLPVGTLLTLTGKGAPSGVWKVATRYDLVMEGPPQWSRWKVESYRKGR